MLTNKEHPEDKKSREFDPNRFYGRPGSSEVEETEAETERES